MQKREAVRDRFIILLLSLIILLPAVLADTAGPNNPAKAVSNSSFGTESWDNAWDAKISDDDHSDVTLDDYENSTYLKATNFSFTLPGNSIIHGIIVDVERRVSSTGSGSIVRDASVRLLKAGIAQGDDRATSTPYTTTDTYESHGNATDTWGSYWTAADINSPYFGAVFAATKANPLGGDRDIDVDHIRIAIKYSIDNASPAIAILGLNPAVIEYQAAYTDAGATAVDDFSGDVTGAIIAAGSVDTNVLGSYTINYTVNDSVGNIASATRTINVVDTTPPVLTLIGSNPLIIEAGSAYSEPGATAADSHDGNITGAITITGTASTNALGNYTINYTINDSSGNAASASRTVEVIDTTPPAITLIGGDIEILQDRQYNDHGATALDNADGDITSSIIMAHQVSTQTPARYTVRYFATDSSGNKAEAYRTVTVIASEASGLGTREGSYFAQQVQAESGPRAETTSAATTGTSSTGSEGEAESSTTTQSAGTQTAAAPTTAQQNALTNEPRNPIPITGATVGQGTKTNWKWPAALGIIVLGLLGTAWIQRAKLKRLLSSRAQPPE